MINGRRIVLLLGLLAAATLCQATSKGMLFFYRMAERVDRFLLQNVDTSYIALPENSWRLAYTNSMVGINSYYRTTELNSGNKIALLSRTTPSIEVGFHAAYRGLGFGYSWDVVHAYARNLDFSLGSKMLGIEFQRQVSTHLSGVVINPDDPKNVLASMPKDAVMVTNTNLTAWYALNSEHYSHNAAIKQTFIQKRSAGSLLLSLSYLSTDMALQDSFSYSHVPAHAILIDSVKHIVTHQVAAGLGYGINYTPNNGKVLLHAAANVQLVFYSINQLSLEMDSTIRAALPVDPLYNIQPKLPVHVTGNIRAAVSWEINRWVHLSLWGKASNIRFHSREGELADIRMRNWNWQVHLNIGVRLGAGYARRREALKDDPVVPLQPMRTSKLPQWVTDYFYSPSL